MRPFLLAAAMLLPIVPFAAQGSAAHDISEKKQGAGKLLFSVRPTQEEKNNFLEKTEIKRLFTPQRILNLNTQRSKFHDAPLSPVVELKGEGVPFVPFSAAFPQSFRLNIPRDLRDRIEQYDIDSLDLLFTAQHFEPKVGQTVSLNCGYWLVPQLEPNFSETVFKGRVLIEFLDPDHPIDEGSITENIKSNFIKEDWLKPFNILIADDKVFNDSALLNLKEVNGLFSAWSLVIDRTNRRAAVTLHWLMDTATLNEFSSLFKDNIHFKSFVAELGENEIFKRTKGLKKLLDFIK